MSTSKALTRKPYGENRSDLRIGDYVRLDHAYRENQKDAFIARLGNPLMIVTGFEINPLIGSLVLVDNVQTGEPIRTEGGIGFWHKRFVRDEFLTAAKRAIADAKV